jgi:hypothetical protein
MVKTGIGWPLDIKQKIMKNPLKNKFVLYGTIGGLVWLLWFKFGKKKKQEEGLVGGDVGSPTPSIPNIIFPIFGNTTTEEVADPPAPEVEDLGETTVTNTATTPTNTSGCANTFTIYESGSIFTYNWNNGQPTVTKTIEPVAMFSGELNAIGSGINTPITTSITLAQFQAACDKKKTGNYDTGGGGGGGPLPTPKQPTYEPIVITVPENPTKCADTFALWYSGTKNNGERYYYRKDVYNWNAGNPTKTSTMLMDSTASPITTPTTVSSFKYMCQLYQLGYYAPPV